MKNRAFFALPNHPAKSVKLVKKLFKTFKLLEIVTCQAPQWLDEFFFNFLKIF